MCLNWLDMFLEVLSFPLPTIVRLNSSKVIIRIETQQQCKCKDKIKLKNTNSYNNLSENKNLKKSKQLLSHIWRLLWISIWYSIFFQYKWYHINGVMVNMLGCCRSWGGQTKDNNSGICCFSVRYLAVRSEILNDLS
jgi:hypothetical protein